MFMNLLRKNQSWILWILVVVVSVLFITLYGQGGGGQTTARPRIYAGTIGGQRIDQQELLNTYYRMLPFLRYGYQKDRGQVAGDLIGSPLTGNILAGLSPLVYGRWMISTERQGDKELDDMYEYRKQITTYFRYRRSFVHLKHVSELTAMGFHVSSGEIIELENKLMRWNLGKTDDDELTVEDKEKSLRNMNLTLNAFRQGARETLLLVEFSTFLFSQAQVSETSRYLSYMQDNMENECLWKDFYEDSVTVTPPTDEAIKAYYDSHKTMADTSPESLYAEPAIKLAYIRARAIDFKPVGPESRSDLLDYYRNNKDEFKRKLPERKLPEGGTPHASKKAPLVVADRYLPFYKVEERIRKKVRAEHSASAARAAMKRFAEDYEKMRRAMAVLPMSIRDRGMNVDQLVAQHKLRRGTMASLETAEAFEKGSVRDLGELKLLPGDLMDIISGASRRPNGSNRNLHKAFFTNTVYSNDQGAVVVRVLDYKPHGEILSYEAARDIIVKRLNKKNLASKLKEQISTFRKTFEEEREKTEGVLITRLLKNNFNPRKIDSKLLEKEWDVFNTLRASEPKDVLETALEKDDDDPASREGTRVAMLLRRHYPKYATYLQDRDRWLPLLPTRVVSKSLSNPGLWTTVYTPQYSFMQSFILPGYVVMTGMKDLAGNARNEFEMQQPVAPEKKVSTDTDESAPQ